MRLLGIDYGAKKIGLALSDPTGMFPAPLEVLTNTPAAIKTVASICGQKGIEKIIIGRSLNYAGRPNPVNKKIKRFGWELAVVSKLPVEYENEILTTQEADRISGRDKQSDARAAALILNSYIDKQKYKKINQ